MAINSYRRRQIPEIFPLYAQPQDYNPTPVEVTAPIISLGPNIPNGQFSDVVLKGLTATNFVKNGNFALDSNSDGLGDFWIKSSAVSETYIVNDKQYWRNTSGADSTGALNYKVNIKADKQYYIRFSGHRVYSVYMDGVALWHDSTKAEGTYSRLYTRSDDYNNSISFRTWVIALDDPAASHISNIMIINLTDTFGSGNEPTKEQSDKIFTNWFDGTKSTLSHVAKVVGKNFFSTSVEDWEQGSIDPTTGIEFAAITRMRNKKYARVPALTQVILSKAEGYGLSSFWEFDINKNFIKYTASITGITTTAQTAYIRSVVSKSGGTQEVIPSIDLELVKPQLERGTVATEYEPYKESSVIINLSEPLKSLPNGVKDEIRVSEGKLIKRVSDKYQLKNDDIEHLTVVTNLLLVRIRKHKDSLTYGTVNNSLWRVKTYEIDGFYPSIFTNEALKAGGFYDFSETQIALMVPLGTYGDIEEARLALAGTALTYQLAVPVITAVPDEDIPCYTSGTLYIESEDIDAGNSTLPTVVYGTPPGIHLPVEMRDIDLVQPKYLDQDFRLG